MQQPSEEVTNPLPSMDFALHGPPASTSPNTSSVPIWNLGDTNEVTHAGGAGAKSQAPGLRRGVFSLHMKASTWAADSHGLFDYESRNVYGKIFKCNCLRDSYQIVRIGSEVHFLPEDRALAFVAADPRAKVLAQVAWLNGSFQLIPTQVQRQATVSPSSSNNERLWLVVRTMKDRAVGLMQGDVVKLGRYRLKVKEIVVSPQEAKALASRRFWCHDDEDDCETVAPDPVDLQNDPDYLAVSQNDDTGLGASVAQPDFVAGYSNVDRFTDLVSSSFRAPCSAEPPHVTVELTARSEPSSIMFKAKSSLSLRICRICLCEADDDDIDCRSNPLVAPCECKGSMKWVHLLCLRTWMAGRLNIRNDGSMVCYFWRSLECELCKVPYPPVVKIMDFGSNALSSTSSEDGEGDNTTKYRRMSDFKASYGAKLYLPEADVIKKSKSASNWRTVELFKIPRPEVPYAILEPKSQQCRGLHVVSLANNKVARMGRGHESDIRLADISVSRLHAWLRFQAPPAKRNAASTLLGGSTGVASLSASPHGCFVVEDNRSKFGTLLEIRKPFPLDPNSSPLSIQVGRTVLTFSLKRRWRFRIPACLRHQSNDITILLHQPPQQLGVAILPRNALPNIPLLAPGIPSTPHCPTENDAEELAAAIAAVGVNVPGIDGDIPNAANGNMEALTHNPVHQQGSGDSLHVGEPMLDNGDNNLLLRTNSPLRTPRTPGID